MAALQIQIAELIKEQFAELPDYEVWRDCAGTLHWTAVKDGKVLEATCYVDDDNYDLICDMLDDEDEAEDIEETDDEEETDEEEDSDDDDFIIDEDDEPEKKKRKM